MTLAQLPARSLLEAGRLPLSELVRLAAREGRRPRPIYQIHKWFARRLGCSFRAILIGAVETESADFWKAYYESEKLQGLTVLDPFVGGGTSVVEAARLGASAIGIDVDPIACVVTDAELKAGQLLDLGATLKTIASEVGEEITRYHATRGRDGKRLAVLHHFWVQVVECPKCEEEGEAHPNFLLSDGQHGTWGFCRRCHEPRKLRLGQGSFTCQRCRTVTVLAEAPVLAGTYSCPSCSHKLRLIDVGRSTGQPPEWRLFALETCKTTSQGVVPIRERSFKRASVTDRRAFERASRELQRELRADREFLPSDAPVTVGHNDARLRDYGYRDWKQLFNDRQLLHLGRLARKLKRLPPRQRRAFGLAFSNHLTTNCMMASYASGWRRLTPLFSIRAFRHIPRPVELNPWSQGTGRGSYPNAIRQLRRAAEFARAPKEPRLRGGFKHVDAIAPRKAPLVTPGNACDLSLLTPNSVDLVLTDPPYFDNVAYSELSAFFQPWLEQLGLVPPASERQQLIRGALRAKRGDAASVDEFASNLGRAFVQIERVLKPNGMLAFTFRHSTSQAWYALAKALSRTSLRPMRVLPIPGEAGAGLHNHDGTSLWDAVLVFRKTSSPRPISKGRQSAHLRQACRNAQHWRDKLYRKHRLPFADADFINLLRASIVAASLGLYGATTRDWNFIRKQLKEASAE